MTNTELKAILEKAQPGVTADFEIGTLASRPDSCGCYYENTGRYPEGWYLYDVDDHAARTLTGPFDARSIVFACALKLHISDSLQNWKFSEQARETYLHGHIHE